MNTSWRESVPSGRPTAIATAFAGLLWLLAGPSPGPGLVLLWIGLGLAIKGNALVRWVGAFVLALGLAVVVLAIRSRIANP
jgi:hypothetical protein